MCAATAQLPSSVHPDEDPAPVWLWPNVLSLDAPLVAVLWQGFLADRFALPLRPAGRLALGLTVWAIYLLDRLLDARRPPPLTEPARHRYYRRHSKLMAALFTAVVTADALIAILWLRPAVLRDGSLLSAAVLVYLGAFHISGLGFKPSKEISAAMLFTAGTFLTAWTTIPGSSLAWPAVAFFALCLANMVAIEAWEWRELPNKSLATLHPCTRWLARTYSFWVPVTVIVCGIAGRNKWYLSIAVSAGACALLFGLGRRVSLEARRVLVDGALLSPILFSILR